MAIQKVGKDPKQSLVEFFSELKVNSGMWTQQVAKGAASSYKCPTCPDVGRVGIHLTGA